MLVGIRFAFRPQHVLASPVSNAVKWLACLLLLVGCGGSIESPADSAVPQPEGGADSDSKPDTGIDVPTSADSAGDTVVARTPKQHRASSIACSPAPLPPEPQIPDAGLGPSAVFECRVHADCVEHPRGRCIFHPTDPPFDPGGTRCSYDECQYDTDCMGGAVCACGDVANTCLPGNCRIDSDCGAGHFCSPNIDPCMSTITGYFCHTTADECVDDSDCDPTQFEMYCQYDGTAGQWTCPRSMCGA